MAWKILSTATAVTGCAMSFANRSKDVVLNRFDPVCVLAATDVACGQSESHDSYLMDDCHRRGYEHKLHDLRGWHDQHNLCDN
jgi:hypothetical protein